MCPSCFFFSLQLLTKRGKSTVIKWEMLRDLQLILLILELALTSGQQ